MITARQLAMMGKLWEIDQWVQFNATPTELNELIAEIYKSNHEGARIIAALFKTRRPDWTPPDYIAVPVT